MLGDPGQCSPYPNFSSEDPDTLFYCDSAVDFRLSLSDDDNISRLDDTGFCVEETIDTEQFPRSCLISTEQYELVECDTRPDGLAIQWTNPAWFQILGGLDINNHACADDR